MRYAKTLIPHIPPIAAGEQYSEHITKVLEVQNRNSQRCKAKQCQPNIDKEAGDAVGEADMQQRDEYMNPIDLPQTVPILHPSVSHTNQPSQTTALPANHFNGSASAVGIPTMVRFAASTTALLLAAGTVLNAKPIVQPRISHTSKNTTISANNTTTSGNTTTTSGNTTTVAKYDVGFDDSLVRTLKTTDVVPELVFLDSPEYKTMASADNVTSLEPFIPSQDRSEINGKNADSFKRWINGKDDREQFTSKEYPWASVGRM
jgi:hypothetical protein